jgi:hypothetical protein
VYHLFLIQFTLWLAKNVGYQQKIFWFSRESCISKLVTIKTKSLVWIQRMTNGMRCPIQSRSWKRSSAICKRIPHIEFNTKCLNDFFIIYSFIVKGSRCTSVASSPWKQPVSSKRITMSMRIIRQIMPSSGFILD